jgi:hypothetical protein
MVTMIRIDGQPFAPGTGARVQAVIAEFNRQRFRDNRGQLVTLHIYEDGGKRDYEDQVRLFLSRYRAQPTGAGPYRDVRWWNGVRYVRVNPGGTVAQPRPDAPHVRGAAADFHDSGADAGVSMANNQRSNWLRANAPRFGLLPVGYGFGEPWHYENPADPWDAPAPASLPGAAVSKPKPSTKPTPKPTPLPKEDGTMQSIIINGNQYGVAPEFITHYGNLTQASITRRVTSATDELHDLGKGKAGVANLGALLDGLNIDPGVLDSSGKVLNPLTGKHEANGTWSRSLVVQAKLAMLDKKLSNLRA